MPFNLSSTAQIKDPRPALANRHFRFPDGVSNPVLAQVRLQPPAFGPSRPGSFDQARAEETGAISIPLGQLGIVLSVSAPQARSPLGSTVTVGRDTAEAREAGPIQLDLDGRYAGRDASRSSQQAGRAQFTPERHSADPLVERLSGALEAAEHSQDPLGNVYADAVRLAIVARLLALHSETEARRAEQPAPTRTALPKWRLKRVIEYIDAHIDETISLADMAAVVGLSRMHFAAQFRAATGVRPHEFLLRRRIDRAKQMLVETETSLVEIALSVGFQTQAHFTTVFKRFVGLTPHRWRSRSRSEDRDAWQGDRDIWLDPARGSGAPFAHQRA